jgi:hypothetical protein
MLYKVEIQQKLLKYFMVGGHLMGKLDTHMEGLYPVFSKDELGQQTFLEEAKYFKRQVDYLKKQTRPLTYSAYKVEVLPVAYRELEKEIEVDCIVKEVMQYDGLGLPTKKWSKHLFSCKKGDNFAISYHGRGDIMGDVTLKKRGKTSEKIKIPHIPVLTREDKENLRQKRLERIAQTPGLKGYDWEKAVAYAKAYAVKPNTPTWANYEANGSDCTNFVSQCLYQSGLPFDKQSDALEQRWFWEDEKNYSPSWSVPNAFKNYLLSKEMHGIVTQLIPESELLIGDVIQLGTTKETRQTLLVTDYLCDPKDKNKIIDVAVSYHGTDFAGRGENVPLALQPCEKVAYAILGYWEKTQ